jgi:Arginase family
MARYGPQFGPDITFLGVARCDWTDPAHAPGTGTPEPGGLSARQLLDAVRRICYALPVAGIDVVEVAPPYDHAGITSSLANRVVLEALSALAGGAVGAGPQAPRRGRGDDLGPEPAAAGWPVNGRRPVPPLHGRVTGGCG